VALPHCARQPPRRRQVEAREKKRTGSDYAAGATKVAAADVVAGSSRRGDALVVFVETPCPPRRFADNVSLGLWVQTQLRAHAAELDRKQGWAQARLFPPVEKQTCGISGSLAALRGLRDGARQRQGALFCSRLTGPWALGKWVDKQRRAYEYAAELERSPPVAQNACVGTSTLRRFVKKPGHASRRADGAVFLCPQSARLADSPVLRLRAAHRLRAVIVVSL
jgi:hypothetical protein